MDGLVLRDRDTDANGTLDERLYALQDANWNTTALVNTSGTIQERYTYTPFGQVTFRDSTGSTLSNSAKDWVFLHQGGEKIAAGDYEFRNRVHSPTLGRWLSNDPLGFEAGDQNWYRAIGNNPGNGMDPSGLVEIEIRYTSVYSSGYYHAFIIIKDDNGVEYIYRGGPKNQNPFDWGNIDVHFKPFDKNSPDWRDTYPYVVPIVKNNEPAGPYMEQLKFKRDVINLADIPYRPTQTNSNFTVHEGIRSLSIVDPSIKNPKHPVRVPGYNDFMLDGQDVRNMAATQERLKKADLKFKALYP